MGLEPSIAFKDIGLVLAFSVGYVLPNRNGKMGHIFYVGFGGFLKLKTDGVKVFLSIPPFRIIT